MHLCMWVQTGAAQVKTFWRHFKVVLVSDKFKSMKNLIARHRAVNEVLAEELSSGVHALSIIAKTPEQWENSNEVKPSPACRGGFGK